MIDLILDNEAVENEEFKDLFKELFNNQENRKYYKGIELSEEYVKAIDILFDEELSIDERILDSMNECMFCFESFYFFKMLTDERDLYNFADLALYSAAGPNRFKDKPEYEKIAASLIYEDISSLYMYRDNYKKAITSLYTQNEIDPSSFELNKIKLFICFEHIEDYDSFKRFYDMNLVNDVVSYLLYICVLIKTLKTNEIVEVLMDMFHDFEDAYEVIKARFLDEDYTADEEIDLAFDVAKSSIESIPNFFDILIDIIEKNNIKPNTLQN